MEIHGIVQEAVTKTILKKKKSKAKWLSDEVLQIPEKRREAKAREKGKGISSWMQSIREYQEEIRRPS